MRFAPRPVALAVTASLTLPGLAEDWEYSDDGTVLTLHVREGVTFHHGEPLDAEAVVANLERAMTHEASTVSGHLATVEEVDVVDDHRVDLHLARADATVPGHLSPAGPV